MDEARRIQQDEEEAERMEDCLEGLKSSAGYLRRALAKALTVRHIPHLIFKPDRGIENAARVHALLKEIEGEKRSAEE
jgi:ribosome-binding factor A